MPRATNGVVNEQPRSKRTGVVRAYGTDREQFVITPREQNRLAMSAAQQHASAGEIRQSDPLDEIRPLEVLRLLTHSILLDGMNEDDNTPASNDALCGLSRGKSRRASGPGHSAAGRNAVTAAPLPQE